MTPDPTSDARPRFVDRLLSFTDTADGWEVDYRPLDGVTPIAVDAVPRDFVDRARVGRWLEGMRWLVSEEDVGDEVARLALPPGIRPSFLADLEQARVQSSRVRLWFDDSALNERNWPWEYVRLDEVQPRHLATHPHCAIVRHVAEDGAAAARALDQIEHDVIKVLIVWSEPDGRVTGAKRIVDAIQHELSGMPRDRVQVKLLKPHHEKNPEEPVATAANVQRALADGVHVAVFLTHGSFDPFEGCGLLLLEDPAGKGPVRVADKELLAMVRDADSLALILFQSCRTSDRGPYGTATSLAERLACTGRVVLGQQFDYPVSQSPTFWSVLVRGLAAGRALDECVAEARHCLHDIGIGHGAPFWGIPTVHRPCRLPTFCRRKRSPDEVLELVHLVRGGQTAAAIRALAQLSPETMAQLADVLESDDAEGWERFRATWESGSALKDWTLGDAHPAIVYTRPVWWTKLRTCPSHLAWWGTPQVPLSIRMRVVGETTPCVDEVVESSEFAIPESIRKRIGDGAVVRWSVAVADNPDKPLVRARFEVATGGCFEPSSPPLHESECLRLRGLLAADRYDELLAGLRGGIDLAAPARRLADLMLSGTYQRLSGRLTEDRLAGEAAWARALAARHARLAF